MKTLTPTQLRKQIYSVFDSILVSGRPQRIRRKGETFIISVENKKDKLASLPRQDFVVGDSDELVSLNVFEWNEVKNL